MIQEECVYCVGCSHIITKETARQIFRTGFYRCTMRIALCDRCFVLDHDPDSTSAVDSSPDYMAVDPL